MESEVEALKALLDGNDTKYKILTHERVYTSEQAAKIRGVPLSSGVKAMVVKSEKGFFLVLVPGNKKIDFNKLMPKIGKAKLASAEDVFRLTGCEVGSVHPFGNLFGLQVFMDRHILDNSTVNFNAGLHEISINMRSRDMAETIKPEIGEFSK
ncbi:MAG TPA: YbaK/EbsC family protein [archaeon]|nr:YbaK/EbsC family protein [archaeon]